MPQSKSKIVAVYDYNAHGHHHSYVTVITRVLVQAGCRVWVFARDPHTLIKNLPESINRSDIRAFPVEPPAVAAGKVQRNLLMGRISWLEAAKRIRSAQEQEGESAPDLVLFLSLADFVRGFISRSFVESVFPHSWGGLMVHVRLPHIIRSRGLKDRLLNALQHHRRRYFHALDVCNARNCRFFLTLQEDCLEQLRKCIRIPVRHFPDITAEEVNPDHPLIKEIKLKARGRKIIALPGNQNERKGSYMLLDIARRCVEQDWFFVFAGDENYPRNDARRQIFLNRIKEFARADNCFFHLEHIADPAVFNGLFAVSDLIFAVYDDFPFSSNVLTKAALFQVPVISAGGLMGERVKRFRLGLTCAFGDSEACIAVMSRLLNGEPENPGYRDYYRENSCQRTQEILTSLLEA